MNLNRTLFVAQRLTALLLGPLVLIHLGLILYAVQGGLNAAEILGRTQGSVGWGLFYGVFVVSAAIHGPIGVRNVLREWSRLPQQAIDIGCVLFAILLAFLGLRAVIAVI